MSFQEKYARFKRQHEDHATWKLLKADNAPLILAFVTDLFSQTNEMAFDTAATLLDAELNRLREHGLHSGEVSARGYLRQWIADGWLRELNDILTRTDACELAMRFARGLEDRDTNATASHLRVVQDAVRELAIALNPDPQVRIQLLESRKLQLQQEIDDLEAGVVYQLPSNEQRERIREVYQLASELTGDFRRVEDEIRQMDQSLRIEMIQSASNRGDILQSLLHKENILAQSDAGRAFDGFFQLLCDVNRRNEFHAQLKLLLNHPAAEYLSRDQCRYLQRLLKELTHQSDHVLHVRKRTEESLRNFIESGALLENRAVTLLLGNLEKAALELRENGVSIRTDTGLWLNSGAIKINTPMSMNLRSPQLPMEASPIVPALNHTTVNDVMLSHLQSVPVTEVARTIKQVLQQHGPLSVAGIVELLPIEDGLEALVAYLRVTKAVKATVLEGRETVTFRDRSGQTLRATIPHFLLDADLFPAQIEELSL